jgi:acylphosphatase
MDGIRFVVSGRVQGVGFRAWTRVTARRLGVVGTVRNLSDGRVQVDALAPPPVLNQFRAQLRHGPPSSHVDSLTEEPVSIPPTTTFEIGY